MFRLGIRGLAQFEEFSQAPDLEVPQGRNRHELPNVLDLVLEVRSLPAEFGAATTLILAPGHIKRQCPPSFSVRLPSCPTA